MFGAPGQSRQIPLFEEAVHVSWVPDHFFCICVVSLKFFGPHSGPFHKRNDPDRNLVLEKFVEDGLDVITIRSPITFDKYAV